MAIPFRFRKIVGGATAAAGAIGVPGAFSFGSDVIALKTIWVTGTVLIFEKTGLRMTKEEAMQIATAALVGAATFVAGSKLAAKLFHLVPGPGTLGAICINSFLDAFFTYRFLRTVSKVADKYDQEEINFQVITNSMSFFNLWTFLDDIDDMKNCIGEGLHMKAAFG